MSQQCQSGSRIPRIPGVLLLLSLCCNPEEVGEGTPVKECPSLKIDELASKSEGKQEKAKMLSSFMPFM